MFVILNPEDDYIINQANELAYQYREEAVIFGPNCFSAFYPKEDRVTFVGHMHANKYGLLGLSCEQFVKKLTAWHFPFNQVKMIDLSGCEVGLVKNNSSFAHEFNQRIKPLTKHPITVHAFINQVNSFKGEPIERLILFTNLLTCSFIAGLTKSRATCCFREYKDAVRKNPNYLLLKRLKSLMESSKKNLNELSAEEINTIEQNFPQLQLKKFITLFAQGVGTVVSYEDLKLKLKIELKRVKRPYLSYFLLKYAVQLSVDYNGDIRATLAGYSKFNVNTSLVYRDIQCEAGKSLQQIREINLLSQLFALDLVDEITTLIKLGTIDVNQKVKDAHLIHLVVKKGYGQVLSLLLDKQAELNIRDQQGFAPIHYAAMKNFTSSIKELVNHGANINFVSAAGDTAAHYAIMTNQIDAIATLAELGADFTTVSSNLGTPIHMACAANNISALIAILLNLSPEIPFKADDFAAVKRLRWKMMDKFIQVAKHLPEANRIQIVGNVVNEANMLGKILAIPKKSVMFTPSIAGVRTIHGKQVTECVWKIYEAFKADFNCDNDKKLCCNQSLLT